MVGLENETVISDYVKAEAEEPSAEKLDGDRTVYLSRNNFGHPKSAPGPPKIADFGLAVFGDTSESFHHPIQPDCFRAPEVTLDCGWTYSADIWNLGVFIWELLQKKMLFCAGDKEYDVQNHVAEIIALLGPPPKVLLERGSKTSQFFNEDGQFQRPNLIPTNFNFESLESSLKDEDKTLFIEFMKKLLRWLPEERASAWELYNDPWLHTRTTS
ncbi:MAG: hypothetical protein M1837_004802 [Sclerophora amabilis]|nr:MAG: hypothetical protein M1837_004802 [Sclerophora amabilis]